MCGSPYERPISPTIRICTRARFLPITSASTLPLFACSSSRLRASCSRLTDGALASLNKPSFAQLKATIANLTLANINPEMNAIQAAFRDALSAFIDRWIYAHTSQADFTLSVLNRHYVLHGMNAGNFYRPHDFHRLLLGFDLLIDLIAMINGMYRVMVEADIDKYEERRKFYDQLRGGALQVGPAGDREQELLKQHPNYVLPAMEACVELRK